jgi:patatin-like phospholipase/acyl hydrolase
MISWGGGGGRGHLPYPYDRLFRSIRRAPLLGIADFLAGVAVGLVIAALVAAGLR